MSVTEHVQHIEHVEDDSKEFGFWIYIMTDLVIFGTIFAAYIILRNNTFGGPSGKDIFSMPLALTETLILLASSFSCSLGMYEIHRENKKGALCWFLITFVLGLAFLVIEIVEFAHFIHAGHGPQKSAFLSSYFTLVGTHGTHIFFGLLWMLVAMVRIAIRPLVASSVSRIFRMALFWHFLDFVWIFIFTVVYGMGHLL